MLIVSMLLLLMPIAAFAETEALQINTDKVTGDGEIEVSFVVPNSVTIANLDVKISFDNTKLEATEITWENLENMNPPQGSTIEVANEKGYFSSTWLVYNDFDNIKTPDALKLVSAKFKIKEGATVGNATFAVTEFTAESVDDYGSPVDKVDETGVTIGAEKVVDVYDVVDGDLPISITAPVKGAAPQNSIAEGDGYTGAISWEGNPSVFAAETVYEANVVLTAKDHYQFSQEANPTVAGATTISNIAVEDKKLSFKAAFPATAGADPLAGSVEIVYADNSPVTTPKYGETLKAKTDSLDYGTEGAGTLSYQWYRGDEKISDAVNAEYTLAEADVTKAIKVEVKNSNNSGSVFSAYTSAVEKADCIGSAISATYEVTENSITVTNVTAGQEYALTAGQNEPSEWNNSGQFAQLLPNREYTIHTRIAETSTHKAGTIVTTTATTDKLQQVITIENNTPAIKFGGKLDLNTICNANADGATLLYTQEGSLPDGTSFDAQSGVITAGNTAGTFVVKVNAAAVGDYTAATEQTITVNIIAKDAQVFDQSFAATREMSYGEVDSAPRQAQLTTGDGAISYTSSKTDVADVDGNGKITIKKCGATTITATAAETADYAQAQISYELTIKPANITPVISDIANVSYKGQPQEPDITVSYNGETLSKNIDYTIRYADNTNAGEAKVLIASVAGSNYTWSGEIEKTFVIEPAKLTLTDAEIESKEYDGNTDLVVKSVTFEGLQNNEKLSIGTDYSATAVADSANVNEVTKATVTVTLADTALAENYQVTDTFEKVQDDLITKASAPAAPIVTGSYAVMENDPDKFVYTVDEIAGAEYKMDGGSYQDSNIFENIEPLSQHTFTARIKETVNVNAGMEGQSEQITFAKLDNPNIPVLEYDVTGNSGNRTIIIQPVEGAEYQFDSEGWGTNNIKNGINDEVVNVQIRYAETKTLNASNSRSISVNTAKEPQAAPAAFTLTFALNEDGITYTATIPAVENGLYSFDGTTFTEINTKIDCQPNVSYTGYVKYAETDTHNESDVTTDTQTAPRLTVATPVITPNGGSIKDTTEVKISCATAGAEIYYTLDGSEPNETSIKYTNSFLVEPKTTVKAVAIKETYNNSQIASAVFTKKSTGGYIAQKTLTFDTNGGSEINAVTENYGKTIVLADYTPKRSGYKFLGWYKDEKLTEKIEYAVLDYDMTVYAKWQKTEEIINYDTMIVLTINDKTAVVNGEAVKNDVAPLIVNFRTYTPARFVAESLGAKVVWDEKTRTVTITKDDVKIILTIDSTTAYVSGTKVQMDASAFIADGRTYTPVRFVAEQLGASVEWDEEARTVTIAK